MIKNIVGGSADDEISEIFYYLSNDFFSRLCKGRDL